MKFQKTKTASALTLAGWWYAQAFRELLPEPFDGLPTEPPAGEQGATALRDEVATLKAKCEELESYLAKFGEGAAKTSEILREHIQEHREAVALAGEGWKLGRVASDDE